MPIAVKSSSFGCGFGSEITCRISQGRSRSSSSSASRLRIQFPVAFSIAEFFCAAKPFHPSINTLAPYDFAISTVRSVEPESTTMISPFPSATSGCTLRSVRPMFASSLNVMTTTETCMGCRSLCVLSGLSVISAVQSLPPSSEKVQRTQKNCELSHEAEQMLILDGELKTKAPKPRCFNQQSKIINQQFSRDPSRTSVSPQPQKSRTQPESPTPAQSDADTAHAGRRSNRPLDM